MSYIEAEYLESASRPAERPWTAEENAQHAAGRARTVAMAEARAAAKRAAELELMEQAPRRFTLANETSTVTFTVEAAAVTVTRALISDPGFAGTRWLSLAEARLEYRQLIQDGFRAW